MAATPDMILSKEKAFKKIENEVRLPLIRKVHYHFTRQWFRHRNLTTFSTFLPPRFDGTFPINLLQIGVFEGMDLVWQMQHTAKHPNSRVIGIDPWAMTTKLDTAFMETVYQRAKSNLSEWPNVELWRGKSEDLFSKLPPNFFDLIVIDGDHNADPVYVDAVESLRICRPGGWLLFDDVRNKIPKKTPHVKEGLERFLTDHGDKVDQVWSHRFCECYEKL